MSLDFLLAGEKSAAIFRGETKVSGLGTPSKGDLPERSWAIAAHVSTTLEVNRNAAPAS